MNKPPEGKHSLYCLALSANQCSCPTIVLKASDYEVLCALNAKLVAALEEIQRTRHKHMIDQEVCPNWDERVIAILQEARGERR